MNSPTPENLVPAHAYEPDRHGGMLRFYNPISFVGAERFHTRIWLGQHMSSAAEEIAWRCHDEAVYRGYAD